MKIIDINEKTKIDLKSLGAITATTVLDPEDFSVNLVINSRFAMKMTFDQWEGFVKGVMAAWSTPK